MKLFVCQQHLKQRHIGLKKLLLPLKSIILSIFLIFITISFLNPAGAADTKEKLSEIQKKIQSTMQKVKESRKKEKSVLERMGDIDRSIKKKEQELKAYDKRMSRTQTKIKKLSEEIRRLNTKLGSRQGHLKERLRALYKQQYGGYALLLISATDYQELIKKSKYISMIAYYDNRIINKYSLDIKEINSKKRELESLGEKLRANKEVTKKMQKSLRTDRIKKDKLLAMIRSKRKSYEKSIKELEASSKKLRQMMKRLKKKKLPKSIVGKGFRSLKGRLPWPVSGRVVIPYGKYKNPEFNITTYKNGIELKPAAGEEPKAVSGGRVVYADWFKGYGLLLIIDHGSGYHSLYGNLSEIFLETGNILIEGTVVGKTGKSRLLNFPTLYFEIRHKGKPLDPMKWLKRKARIKKRIK